MGNHLHVRPAGYAAPTPAAFKWYLSLSLSPTPATFGWRLSPSLHPPPPVLSLSVCNIARTMSYVRCSLSHRTSNLRCHRSRRMTSKVTYDVATPRPPHFPSSHCQSACPAGCGFQFFRVLAAPPHHRCKHARSRDRDRHYESQGFE